MNVTIDEQSVQGRRRRARLAPMRPGALAAVLLAVVLVAPAGASAAGYASPGGELTLRTNGASVELRDAHGNVVASDAPGADWVIQGTDGADDTVTVRNPDGGIVPARVMFDGGDGGYDVLKATGGRADSSTSRAAGPGSGSLEYARGSDELVVGYSGLEPVLDIVAAASATYTFGATSDAITIDDGATVGDGRLRVD